MAAQKNPVIRSAPLQKTKPASKKPAAKKATAKNVKANARQNIAAAISKLPAVCSDNTKECMCKKACAPRPVSCHLFKSPGGGVNYHICWYGICKFFRVSFIEQKINFGVSILLKSQVVIHFGV